MAVNLSKGQKISLKKPNNFRNQGGMAPREMGLRAITVALGWDANSSPSTGFLGFLGLKQAVDCDVACFVCKNGILVDAVADTIYYGNLKHHTGAIRHMGDNLTGAGAGDDEQIKVNLDKLPPEYDRLIFTVNIYMCHQRRQDFGLIRNAFIRIVDDDSWQEICRYNLTQQYAGMTAMIFGEIFRTPDGWQFSAIGEPTRDGSIGELSKKFM